METKKLLKEMNKKRDQVLDCFKNRRNKEVHEATGLAPGYISDLKAGRKRFKDYEKVLNTAEKLGI